MKVCFIQTTEDAHSKNQFCRFRKTIRQGIDLFQSPNEVTQISANTLETKFYLLKKDQSMQGKCLPASSVQLITGNMAIRSATIASRTRRLKKRDCEPDVQHRVTRNKFKNSFSYLLNSVTRDSELTRATRSDFEV